VNFSLQFTWRRSWYDTSQTEQEKTVLPLAAAWKRSLSMNRRCRHAAVAIPYATPRAWGETDKSRWDPDWCTESASTVQMIKGFANRDVFIETLSKLAWLPWNKGRSCTLQHSHNNLEVKFPLNICKTRSICKSGKKISLQLFTT